MKRIRFLVLPVLLLGLVGCSGLSAEDLYCLPEATEAYYDLQSALSQVLDTGLSYHAPSSGARQEPVQLVDLTGDGVEEAVAFFRDDSDGSISAYIFSLQDGAYATAGVIDCAGSAIGSVGYADLTGDGSLELIISCQVSEAVTGALQVSQWDGTPLLTCPASSYVLSDLQGEGTKALITLTGSGTEAAAAEAFVFTGDALESAGTVSLSGPVTSISAQTEASLSDGTPALIFSLDGEESRSFNTLLLSDNTLTLLPLVTTDTIRGLDLCPMDMDGDGAIELPQAQALRPYGEGTTAQSIVVWQQATALGDYTPSVYTYHDPSGKWYLQLPQSWATEVTAREEALATATYTASSVTFYHLTETGAVGEPLLTLYTLRGEARQSYAEEHNLTILRSDTEVIFAALLGEDSQSWSGALTIAQVSDQFHSADELPEEAIHTGGAAS